MPQAGVPHDLPARVDPDVPLEVVPRSVQGCVLVTPLLRSPRRVGKTRIREADEGAVVPRVKIADEQIRVMFSLLWCEYVTLLHT